MAKRESLTVKLEPQIEQYLRQLIRTGLYGRTAEEVARDLILEGIRHAVASKFITITSS